MASCLFPARGAKLYFKEDKIVKNTRIILPAVIAASFFLSACKQSGGSSGTGRSGGAVPEKSAAETVSQIQEEPAAHREGPGATGGKPLPKLVPVKSFSERSVEKLDFFRSTAPAPSNISGSSVSANN